MSYWTYGGTEPRFVVTDPDGLAAGDESVLIRLLRQVAASAGVPIAPRLPPKYKIYFKRHGESPLRSVDAETIVTNPEEGFYITSLYEYMTGAKIYEIEWELHQMGGLGR